MISIRPLEPADYPAVQSIYQQGINYGDATFETQVKSWEAWDTATATAARLVAVDAGEVVGWACLSDVSSRCVYGGVAETSVYVRRDYQGRGVGGRLLTALVEASEQAGYWTLQARIFPENEASIAVHRKLGFEPMGRHRRLGKLRGVWRDVDLLERRSEVVGTD